MTRLDLSEFEALNKPRAQCRTGAILARREGDLSQDDLAKFTAALAEPRFTHSTIVKWLSARGIKMNAQTLGRHRNRECTCD